MDYSFRAAVTPQGGKTNLLSIGTTDGRAIQAAGGSFTNMYDVPVTNEQARNFMGMMGIGALGASGLAGTAELTKEQTKELQSGVQGYRDSEVAKRYTDADNYQTYIIGEDTTDAGKISRMNQRWYLEDYGNKDVEFFDPKTGVSRGYLGETAAPSAIYGDYIVFPTGKGISYDTKTQSSWMNTPDSERLGNFGFTDNVIYSDRVLDRGEIAKVVENLEKQTGGTDNRLLTTGIAPAVDVFANIKRTPAEQKEFLASKDRYLPKLNNIGAYGDREVRFTGLNGEDRGYLGQWAGSYGDQYDSTWFNTGKYQGYDYKNQSSWVNTPSGAKLNEAGIRTPISTSEYLTPELQRSVIDRVYDGSSESSAFSSEIGAGKIGDYENKIPKVVEKKTGETPTLKARELRTDSNILDLMGIPALMSTADATYDRDDFRSDLKGDVFDKEALEDRTPIEHISSFLGDVFASPDDKKKIDNLTFQSTAEADRVTEKIMDGSYKGYDPYEHFGKVQNINIPQEQFDDFQAKAPQYKAIKTESGKIAYVPITGFDRLMSGEVEAGLNKLITKPVSEFADSGQYNWLNYVTPMGQLMLGGQFIQNLVAPNAELPFGGIEGMQKSALKGIGSVPESLASIPRTVGRVGGFLVDTPVSEAIPALALVGGSMASNYEREIRTDPVKFATTAWGEGAVTKLVPKLKSSPDVVKEHGGLQDTKLSHKIPVVGNILFEREIAKSQKASQADLLDRQIANLNLQGASPQEIDFIRSTADLPRIAEQLNINPASPMSPVDIVGDTKIGSSLTPGQQTILGNLVSGDNQVVFGSSVRRPSMGITTPDDFKGNVPIGRYDTIVNPNLFTRDYLLNRYAASDVDIMSLPDPTFGSRSRVTAGVLGKDITDTYSIPDVTDVHIAPYGYGGKTNVAYVRAGDVRGQIAADSVGLNRGSVNWAFGRNPNYMSMESPSQSIAKATEAVMGDPLSNTELTGKALDFFNENRRKLGLKDVVENVDNPELAFGYPQNVILDPRDFTADTVVSLSDAAKQKARVNYGLAKFGERNLKYLTQKEADTKITRELNRESKLKPQQQSAAYRRYLDELQGEDQLHAVGDMARDYVKLTENPQAVLTTDQLMHLNDIENRLLDLGMNRVSTLVSEGKKLHDAINSGKLNKTQLKTAKSQLARIERELKKKGLPSIKDSARYLDITKQIYEVESQIANHPEMRPTSSETADLMALIGGRKKLPPVTKQKGGAWETNTYDVYLKPGQMYDEFDPIYLDRPYVKPDKGTSLESLERKHAELIKTRAKLERAGRHSPIVGTTRPIGKEYRAVRSMLGDNTFISQAFKTSEDIATEPLEHIRVGERMNEERIGKDRATFDIISTDYGTVLENAPYVTSPVATAKIVSRSKSRP